MNIQPNPEGSIADGPQNLRQIGNSGDLHSQVDPQAENNKARMRFTQAVRLQRQPLRVTAYPKKAFEILRLSGAAGP